MKYQCIRCRMTWGAGNPEKEVTPRSLSGLPQGGFGALYRGGRSMKVILIVSPVFRILRSVGLQIPRVCVVQVMVAGNG